MSQPVTSSERHLQHLCRSTFLSLWSFPNVYRDQGGGKEICDVLVVFGNNIIIFSDKECEYPNTGNAAIDWNRWFKKSIRESAKQLRGAERWLRDFPDRVFIDRECTKVLPIDLPDPRHMKILRIIVVHGAQNRCREKLGGTGGLMIDTSLTGDTHLVRLEPQTLICNADELRNKEFFVGYADEAQGFIHVLDDISLNIVLQELDTVSDFVTYLKKKEEFIQKVQLVLATSEEDILAYYLQNTNDIGEHGFDVPQADFVCIDDWWASFETSPERRAQKSANQDSYEWDRLIERLTTQIETKTLRFATHQEIGNQEKLVRWLASEARLARRFLATRFLDLRKSHLPHFGRLLQLVEPIGKVRPHYVFLGLQRPPNVSDDDYLTLRLDFLYVACASIRTKCPTATDVIGIATELGGTPFSYDCIYLDMTSLTNNEIEKAKADASFLGIGEEWIVHNETVQEYPLVPRFGRPRKPHSKNKAHKTSRNAPCPCGSGRKYKHCCLRLVK